VQRRASGNAARRGAGWPASFSAGLRYRAPGARFDPLNYAKGFLMNSIVYIVGAVVIIVALMGFLGLR